ncbi:MAG: dephospho-CoA kinase [Polyangiaceae bacterium]|jgi:dephospho-CoA kinase
MYSRKGGLHLFGLTGGIASGKSTVAARFRAHGVPVIDADQLAREVVAPGTAGLGAVVNAFGPEMLGRDGTLDRKKLASVVFSDEAARQRLNGITHPRILQRAMEVANEFDRAGEPLACYEAALIVENGAADRFRPLVVVSCADDVQLARVCARSGGSRDDALARIRAQMPLGEKVGAADFVIDTNGSIDESARQADRVLDSVCRRVNVDPNRYGLAP